MIFIVPAQIVEGDVIYFDTDKKVIKRLMTNDDYAYCVRNGYPIKNAEQDYSPKSSIKYEIVDDIAKMSNAINAQKHAQRIANTIKDKDKRQLFVHNFQKAVKK